MEVMLAKPCPMYRQPRPRDFFIRRLARRMFCRGKWELGCVCFVDLSKKTGIGLCLSCRGKRTLGRVVLSRKTDIGLCLFCRRKWGFGIVIFGMCVVCTMYLRVRVCDVCKCVCVHARVCVSSFIQIKSKVTAGNVKYLPRGGQIC